MEQAEKQTHRKKKPKERQRKETKEQRNKQRKEEEKRGSCQEIRTEHRTTALDISNGRGLKAGAEKMKGQDTVYRLCPLIVKWSWTVDTFSHLNHSRSKDRT